MDFKTAFFNGEITDEVSITALDGYSKENGKVLKVHNIRPVSTPADPTVTLQTTNSGTASPNFKRRYQDMVGSLNWPAAVSRPDIAFATGRVGRYSSNPSQQHMYHESLFKNLRHHASPQILLSDQLRQRGHP
jgi:hypothetical protein